MRIFYLAVCMVWFFFLSTNRKSHAQTGKIRFERITVDQGLPDNTTVYLFQDSKGYLWISTLNGLTKYDGYSFTTYQFDPDDTSSIGGSFTTVIIEDKEGIIWAVGRGSAIYLFDRTTEKFTRFKPKAGPMPANLTYSWALNEDREGKIWIGKDTDGELVRYDKQTGKFCKEDYTSKIFAEQDSNTQARPRSINNIYKDKSGTLWIASSNGLYRLNLIPQGAGKPAKISFTSYRHDPKNSKSLAGNDIPPKAIYEDRTGMLWVGGGGLNQLNPKTGECTRYLHNPNDAQSISSNNITGIAEDNEGNLWVSTDYGLNKLNKERTVFTRFFHDDNDPATLSLNSIWSLLLDKKGILWLSFIAGGINKVDLNQNPIAVYQHRPSDARSLSSSEVSAICEDKSGTVWIGTLGGGLNAWNKQTNTFTHYKFDVAKPNSLGSDTISVILEDRMGNLWIGGGKNGVAILSRMNGKRGIFRHYFFKYPYNNTYGNPVLTLYEDNQGFIWIGTTGGAIRFNPKTETWVHYPYDPKNPQGLDDYWVAAIGEDKRGNFWFGHNSNALVKLDPKTGKFYRYVRNPNDTNSLTSSQVKSIFKDSKGTLWFATRIGGFFRLNEENETFTAFTKKDGLPSNTIYSIIEDDDGNLWLTTNKGLCRFSPSTHTFANFDADDGLQSNQFEIRPENSGGCFKGKDGTLYFGGPNGLNVFHPRNLHTNKMAPPVVITRFTLFDKPIPGKNEAKEIVLNNDQNFFSFEFAALNYTNTAKNQYAYQLVGIDKDWVYSGNRRLTSYTDVSPGDYVFRVKASNKDGVWNEQGASVKIIIRPPWWRTGWAYAFYGLCFIVAVFAVHSFQRQRLIRKERERARERELQQAKEIEKAYHELKSTQAQLIQREKMASLGELTAGIAHEIQNPLNFVNNFSEVNKELIGELHEEQSKEPRNFQIENEILNDIDQNLEKVIHHGKRADAIVKGMLQHSRVSTGQKEPTDINALADEYLRLSYHGMRAKDKSFNASLQTDFDTTIGKINVVPQDIGRVLLNLFNNAFYAVMQKKKEVGDYYDPLVSVYTKKLDDKIEITVTDNGVGIPQKVVDKIFQPFFTTKPTGQGTGLGLSLSYDIVKAHGGEIKVETKEGEGSEFIIQLPS
jgi:signal transduction histidine kinase/ligand-binding sensor domain-containing protein